MTEQRPALRTDADIDALRGNPDPLYVPEEERRPSGGCSVLVLALALGIVFGYQVAAPRRAPEPPSTAPALFGAPLYSVVRDTAYIGGRGAADGNTRELTRGLRHSLATVPLVRANSTVPTPVVRGTATWFCGNGSACTKGYPASSMSAAAGSELRHWLGKWVTVTSGSRSVRVKLVDVCACPGRRVIDLYALPFLRLAPLSRGVISVTVTLASAPTLPGTDTAP